MPRQISIRVSMSGLNVRLDLLQVALVVGLRTFEFVEKCPGSFGQGRLDRKKTIHKLALAAHVDLSLPHMAAHHL